MLYVVFSFVFIKYVNDRFFFANLVDRSTLGLIYRPRGSSCLATLARVTRSLQEVVPSFAVAKVYQIPNTNQILTRKTSQNIPQSCTHFPLNKTLTTMEKILCRRCNIPPLSLGIPLKSVPKSSVSLRFHLHPHPKGAPRPRLKGASRPSPKGIPRARLKGAPRPTPKGTPRPRLRGRPPHPVPRADA